MSHQQPYGYPVPVPQTQVLVHPYRCSTAHVVVAWICAVGTLGHLLPWAVAATRNRSNVGAVAMVNLFLGWSLIGWVVALVMACGSNPTVVVVQHTYAPPQLPWQPPQQPWAQAHQAQPWTATPPARPALPAAPSSVSYPEPTMVDPVGSEPTQQLPRSPWEPDHRR